MILLFEKAPVFCKSRNARDLLKKKNIIETNYVFAKLDNATNTWLITDGKSRKYDKVFFTKSFVDTIPEIKEEKVIVDEKNVELAPNIIQLEEHEKFKDENGNVIEIETRGEKKVEGVYFKVKDVAIGFKMEKLQDTLINSISNYKELFDYKYFICIKTDTIGKKNIKKIYKRIYLTYTGFLRVLFVSRNGYTNSFIKWASETLFVMQMGTSAQKEELATSILGVNAKVIKEVFNKDRNTLPCVYLFTLNTVKELRTSMKIDEKYEDSFVVAKYGFTKDLSRRTGEHIKNYNKINGVNLKLKHYSYIDPQYCSNAEGDIRGLMTSYDIKFIYGTDDELVIIPPHLMKIIENHYELTGKKYTGHVSELITKIKDLESEKKCLEYKHNYELAEAKHENEILKKDNQILQLQLQIEKQREHKVPPMTH